MQPRTVKAPVALDTWADQDQGGQHLNDGEASLGQPEKNSVSLLWQIQSITSSSSSAQPKLNSSLPLLGGELDNVEDRNMQVTDTLELSPDNKIFEILFFSSVFQTHIMAFN